MNEPSSLAPVPLAPTKSLCSPPSAASYDQSTSFEQVLKTLSFGKSGSHPCQLGPVVEGRMYESLTGLSTETRRPNETFHPRPALEWRVAMEYSYSNEGLVH